MTDLDPTHRIASTSTTDDLRTLAGHTPPFLTVVLPLPSDHDDADHRLDVRWRNARRLAQDTWPAERLDALDAHVTGLDHGRGEAVVVVQPADGPIFTEYLTIGVAGPRVTIGDAPALVPIVEHRQRTLPHVVVATDRAGADVVAFDAGSVIATEVVEGDTEHIHRGHPGGWSQRRFQQRAENTWERNAGEVADTVRTVAREMAALHPPVLVAVAGEVRARTLVVEALEQPPLDGAPEIVAIETGDPDSIAEETLRRLADLHARLQLDVVERLRATPGSLTDADAVLRALDQGRVDAVLVTDRIDDPIDEQAADVVHTDCVVDRAVLAALSTSASIVVVPRVAEVSDGLAAITRW
jgi:hypothetical protein